MKSNQKSNKRWSFSAGVLMMGSSDVIYIICMFVEMMIAVRFIDSEAYGIYVIMITISNFLVMFIDFGFKTTTIQKIASSDEESRIDIFNSAVLSRMIILIALFFVFLFGKKLLLLFDINEEVLQYALLIPVMTASQSLDELCMSGLQGCQSYFYSSLSWALRSIVRVILTSVFLIVFDFGMMSLVYSWIISFFGFAFFQYLLVPIPKKFHINFQIIKEIITFGFPIQMGRFLWFSSSHINTILIGMFIGPVQVAYYAIADRIPKAFKSMYASFISVFFPDITTHFAEDRHYKAVDRLNQSLRLVSFLMAVCTMIVALWGERALIALFTEKYIESSYIFLLLMLGLQMAFLVQLMGYTLTSAGHPKRSLIENAFRAVLIVFLNLLLIPKIGIKGAAYAILIANYLSCPMAIILLRKSGIKADPFKFVKSILVLWLFVIISHVLPSHSFFIDIGILILYFITNIIIGSISILDFKLIVPDRIMQKIIQKLKGLKWIRIQ